MCGSGSGLLLDDCALSWDGSLGGFCASSDIDDALCDGRLLPTAGYAASILLLPEVAVGSDSSSPIDDMANLRAEINAMADNLCLCRSSTVAAYLRFGQQHGLRCIHSIHQSITK